MIGTRKLMLLGAGALFVATTPLAAQRTTGSGIPVTKDRTTYTTGTTSSTTMEPRATALTVTEVTLPVFDLSAHANMSEANILAHMLTVDSLEIEMARLATTKGSDARVRDFATMLLNDHSAHLATTLEVPAKEGITPVPFTNDVEAARMRGMLVWLANTPAGAPWDAAFLRFQAAHHQNELDILNLNSKNAHDDDFEAHMGKTAESLTKHRDHARSLATQLGITLP